MEENHIQGNDYSEYNIGLFNKEELVSVMTFSKVRLALGHKTNNNTKELSRFCSKINFNIIGGFNKMISFYIKNNTDCKNILTYADCRWSGLNPDKTIYKKSNFEYLYTTKPNYFYLFKKDYFTRYHRFTYNKQVLIKKFNADTNFTEWQIAKNNKMDRIWDCGSMKFVLKINEE